MGTLRYQQKDLPIPGESAKCFICGESLITNVDGKRWTNPGGFWASTSEQWVFLCAKDECVEGAMHLVIDALFDGQIQNWLRGADRRRRLEEAVELLGEKLQKVFWYKVTHLLAAEKSD